MTNMQVEITNVEEEESKKVKISYKSTMDTEAGPIEFTNVVRLDKEEQYLINWSSSLIFPQLNNTDKVRIKTIEAKRGEIVDKNGTLLAGEGRVSSVGIVPGKLGENKDADLEQMATLLGISVDTINNALKASWVKDDTFVPIKKVSKDAEGETLGWFDCFTTDSNSNQLLIVGMVENGTPIGGSHYLISKIKSLF